MADNGCESYELWGQSVFYTWMIGQDEETVELVAKFISDLTLVPRQINAHRVPGYQVPAWGMFVPGTDVGVSWWADEKECKVWILNVDTATDLWGGPNES